MNTRLRTLLSSTALFTLASCSDAQAGTGSIAEIADQPLAQYRRELLDLAFETASALPIQPHVKTRSQSQEVVVEACFELEQPGRALGYVGKIDNWRRGVGYAEYAFYCARHGDSTKAKQYLELANDVYESTEKEGVQDWQRELILAAIAKTEARLESAGEVPAQAIEFDERIRTVDEVVATGDFDQTRSALETCASLFARFYKDPDRRSQAEAKVKASWSKLPILIRVDLMLRLAGVAADHSDSVKALELVEETEAIVEASTWLPQDRIPTMARLAGVRHRAGDMEKARDEADAALALFEAEREQIPNINRAGALRPLAEAYQSMGDTEAALSVYARAVEEGVVNPNSRPRAEDLSATFCSMALHAVEPDAKLRARMLEIRGGLGDPW